MMNIHEFGKENNEIILLIHPSVVKWDYFENVISLLQEKYHFADSRHFQDMILIMIVILQA